MQRPSMSLSDIHAEYLLSLDRLFKRSAEFGVRSQIRDPLNKKMEDKKMKTLFW